MRARPTAAGVDVIAGPYSDWALDLDLADVPERDLRLRQAIEAAQGQWDVILLDCPPSLSLMTMNALRACDAVLVPLMPADQALEGVYQLDEALRSLRHKWGVPLPLLGYLLCAVNRSESMPQVVKQTLHTYAPGALFRHSIGVDASLKKKQGTARITRALDDYHAVALDFLKRLDKLGGPT